MEKYLLDANVIIRLWKRFPFVIKNLIEEKKIKVLKEICKELVIKERKEYKGQELLSDRFCKLLPFIHEIDNSRIKEFNNILDAEHLKEFKADYHDIKKLSENDLLLIYTCYVDINLSLVTEDKSLYHIAQNIIGDNRVLTLETLIDNESIRGNKDESIRSE